MTRAALAPEPVTAASVLALVQVIERHGPAAPAAIAFRAALRRKGLEADATGGPAALDMLMAEVMEADPDCADARFAILRAAWGEVLRGPGGRALT